MPPKSDNSSVSTCPNALSHPFPNISTRRPPRSSDFEAATFMTTDDQSAPVPRWLQPAAHSNALRVVVVILFVGAVGLSAARIQRTLHVPPAVPEFNQGLTDFHTTIYFPALALQSGFNPYSREYIQHFPAAQLPPYSPALFWLSYPFSLLTLEQANVVYFVLSCGLVVGLAASSLAFSRVPLTLVNVLGLATLILLCRPGHISILL